MAGLASLLLDVIHVIVYVMGRLHVIRLSCRQLVGDPCVGIKISDFFAI